MMLALLIYCYANGLFSSRKIERAKYRDVAVRFLTGNTHPQNTGPGQSLFGYRFEDDRKIGVRVGGLGCIEFCA